MKYIVLLRGINISGKNKLPMSELKKVLEENQYTNVSTYLNSGNVILESNTKNEETIMKDIYKIVKAKFNLEIPIFVTNESALESILSNSPEWWGTSNKEIYDNLIFIIPPLKFEDVYNAIGEPKEGLEKIKEYNNSIFWSYDLKNYRKSNWWIKTASVDIKDKITIRTANTMKKILEETYDAVVVGAGHAGCEAALALARLGFSTALFTVSVDSIALMPCNPNVGGSSKGHLVREVDALGGEMGKNIDATFIQSKMLNKSKGPAVHSLRAQADKKEYSKRMRRVLEETENISIKQAEVTELLVENNILVGVKTYTGAIIHCKVCVLCTGTYLKAKCITGEISTYTGPNGLSAANHLSDSLTELGIKIRRFKTGTPARIDGNTVDFSKMEPQYGDEKLVPFSFTNDPADIEREQVKCYLTYTNEKTHEIIRDNLDRSPLYSGMIKSTGPRYCPSIEDKVVRFADKNRHQVFIEPEGLYTSEVYIGGMSSSMPEDVQYEMYRSVKGLENARIVRNAYAIEYDCIDSLELKPSLECKKVEGLFSAGQANGSSGYEEAAAQGIIAGINAARKLQKKDPIILDRSQAYIGVLIDDLVTKGTNEPYRMMTSRAEYRLILRQDNADLRLTPIGYEVGLISKERYDGLLLKDELIQKEMNRMEHTSVGNTDNVQELLKQYGSTPLISGITLAELIRRPELDYDKIESIDKERKPLPYDVCEQVNINIKYDGYISRQMKQVNQFKKMEQKKIPSTIDYSKINSLRIEAVQKLTEIRPESVGQAARISGVSPADISVLLVYLENYNRNVSRETLEEE